MSVTVYTQRPCGYCDMAKATWTEWVSNTNQNLGTDITREELLEILPKC